MIVCESLLKKYDGQVALGPLSVEFQAHKTHTVIGSSGCGKSTLLRLLSGIEAPSSGSMSIDGEILTPQNQPHWARRIGYVIQEGGLFPHYNVQDNVTIMAKQLGWSEADQSKRLKQLLELTALDESFLHRYPQQLSGGQRQRVALMRALMLDPQILLLDEPLGALDPIIRYELQRELRDIFANLNKTVLLVTHDLHEASYLASSVTLLRDGQIEQKGEYEQLCMNPATPFVSQFVAAQTQRQA